MFVLCGEALFDLFAGVSPSPAEAQFAGRVGGSPFNVALGLCRLGAPAGLFTALSTDMLGQRLRQVISAEGISPDYLIHTDRPTTISLIGLDDDGVPAYQFYGNGSADTGIVPQDIPHLGDDITGLHFGSYTMVMPPVADAMAELASRAGGRFVSFDPNIRPTIEPDMTKWHARMEAMLPLCHSVKISAEDLDALYPDMGHARFAQKCLDAGVGLVVITDGGATVNAWTATGLTAIATPPKVDIVDTVGAGDTFQASLLYHLGRTGDPHAALANMTVAQLTEILNISAYAAALTCTRKGADLPHMDELQNFLER